jgi:dethiobiotin synthetase
MTNDQAVKKHIKKRYFVTGTDTDCGKTLISAALLHKAKEQGLKTLGLKPLAAGAEMLDGELRNDDALQLMAQSSVELTYEQVNPILLEEAIAPSIAAERAGRSLDLSRISGLMRGALMMPNQFCIIEGAGGWYVPLNNRNMLSELAADMELPVILVVGMKLGCINHALLTYQAIQQKNIKVAGWVCNQVDKDMAVLDENIATLKRYITAPYLGSVPYIENASAEQVSEYLELDILLNA